MGALPAAATKANLDAATDDPKQARTELADHIDKFNEMRTYLSGLFGTDGAAATARTNLGVDAAFAAGTEQIFGGTTPPTGWTKNTARNDEVVRIVSGTAGGSGGSSSIAGGPITISSDSLTEAQLGVHDHSIPIQELSGAVDRIRREPTGQSASVNSQNAGSGSTHSHDSSSYNIKYRDYVSATHD